MAARVEQIRDDSGYEVTARDLRFLGLDAQAVLRWQAGEIPLGLTKARYFEFLDSLALALARDGITEFDVRLKGSSAQFFAGSHKSMPKTDDELVGLFLEEWGRPPTSVELIEVTEALQGVWPAHSRPLRRPFDSLYRLHLSPSPSDYDVQIASDQLTERARDEFIKLGFQPQPFWVSSPTYSFVRKDLIELIAPNIRFWSQHRSSVVGREITIAIFSSGGPPDVTALYPMLSSHHRESDWKLPVSVVSSDR